MDHLGPWLKRVMLYRDFLMYVGSEESNVFRVILTSTIQYLAPYVSNWLQVTYSSIEPLVVQTDLKWTKFVTYRTILFVVPNNSR